IHLARELQENRCLRDTQLEHWREHARADEEAVDGFPFLTQLQDAIAHLRPARARSVLAAKAQVTAAVHSEIEKLIDQLEKYRVDAKQKIDTPETVARLRRQVKDCASSNL